MKAPRSTLVFLVQCTLIFSNALSTPTRRSGGIAARAPSPYAWKETRFVSLLPLDEDKSFCVYTQTVTHIDPSVEEKDEDAANEYEDLFTTFLEKAAGKTGRMHEFRDIGITPFTRDFDESGKTGIVGVLLVVKNCELIETWAFLGYIKRFFTEGLKVTYAEEQGKSQFAGYFPKGAETLDGSDLKEDVPVEVQNLILERVR